MAHHKAETSSPLQDTDEDLDALLKSILDFEEESRKLIETFTTNEEKSPGKFGTTLECRSTGQLESSGEVDSNRPHGNDEQEEHGEMNTRGENDEQEEHGEMNTRGENEKEGRHGNTKDIGTDDNDRKAMISTKDAENALEAAMQAISSFTGLPPSIPHLPVPREDEITIKAVPTQDTRSDLEEEFGVQLRVKSKASADFSMHALDKELGNLISLSGEAKNVRDVDVQSAQKKSNLSHTQPPTPAAVITAHKENTYTHTQNTLTPSQENQKPAYNQKTHAHTHTPYQQSQKPAQPPKPLPKPVSKPPLALDQPQPVLPPPATTQTGMGVRNEAFIAALKKKVAVDAMKVMKKEDTKNVGVKTSQEQKASGYIGLQNMEEKGVQQEKTEDEWKRGQAFAIANAIKSRNKIIHQ